MAVFNLDFRVDCHFLEQNITMRIAILALIAVLVGVAMAGIKLMRITNINVVIVFMHFPVIL